MEARKSALILIALSAAAAISCASSDGTARATAGQTAPESDPYTADIELPVFDGQDGLNALVSAQADEWLAEFERELQLNNAARGANGSRIDGAFYIDWQEAQDSDELVSVLLCAYSYTGGANGQDRLASFTWSKPEQRLVALEEILPLIAAPPTLEALSGQCRVRLAETLETGGDAFLEEMIIEGTRPAAENFRVFTLSEHGATIYFTKYQVAPGSYGIQEVFIPFLE